MNELVNFPTLIIHDDSGYLPYVHIWDVTTNNNELKKLISNVLKEEKIDISEAEIVHLMEKGFWTSDHDNVDVFFTRSNKKV